MTRKVVFCLECGEFLGKYKQYFAKEHLKECSCMKGFLVKTVIDPLLLKDPDSWFEKKGFCQINRKVTRRKTTDNETESEKMPEIF